METDNRLHSNARRNASTQLARRIGLGYALPLNTLVITTEHTSGDPLDVNTLDRIYSKVSYNHQEHIFVHQPQAGVRYWLVDEESVAWEASPEALHANLLAQLSALEGQPTRHSTPERYPHSTYQPTLTLTTPTVSERDLNFVVVAQDLQRNLLAVQQTRITVKAGVDINLVVSARPAQPANSDAPWLTGKLVTIDYLRTVEVRVSSAQAECHYQLTDTNATPVADSSDGAATDEGYLYRSEPDVLGLEVRDAQLHSVAFAENTRLQVYARFTNTVNDGYLAQQIAVMVRPNLALTLQPDLSDTVARASADGAPVVENPQQHPYTVYYQGSATLVLLQSQQSAVYRLVLKDIDIAANDMVLGSSATDDLYPQIGQEWSEPARGTGTDLSIAFTRSFEEDPTIQVEAIDHQYGAWQQPPLSDPAHADWEPPVVLTQTVKFHVYPDPSPAVISPSEPVPSGSHVIIRLENTQEGISYQLHRQSDDTAVGEPQYHSKNKRLDHAIIGVDFSPNAFEGDIVNLVVPDVTQAETLYIKATKPSSGLSIRLTQTAHITLNPNPAQ